MGIGEWFSGLKTKKLIENWSNLNKSWQDVFNNPEHEMYNSKQSYYFMLLG